MARGAGEGMCENVRGRNRGRKKGANKFLSVMNINAQSLKFKMDELRNLTKVHKPHIIAITKIKMILSLCQQMSL